MVKIFYGEDLTSLEKKINNYLKGIFYTSYSITMTSTVYENCIIYCICVSVNEKESE